jgi:hypothetical protein
MLRERALGITILLALATAAGHAAERTLIATSPFDGSQDAAFRRWGGAMAPRPKPQPPLPPSAAAKARASETAAAVRAQEEANFLRRLAVCDKLRQLALETGDDSLEREADVLQQKAELVYKKRTADASAVAVPAENSRGSK